MKDRDYIFEDFEGCDSGIDTSSKLEDALLEESKTQLGQFYDEEPMTLSRLFPKEQTCPTKSV